MNKNEEWYLFPIFNPIKLYFFRKKVLQQISNMPNEIKMGILMKGNERFFMRKEVGKVKEKTALIAGATGLIGNELLHKLLETSEYKQVYALVRNPLKMNHPKLKEVIVVDFDRLNEYKHYFAVNDVFVCLGTTIKKAKTQEAMYKIDVDYPVEIGRIAKEAGAKHYLVVSSMNADRNAKLFYPRMKGELEEKVLQLNFEQLSIFRPSLLLGNRDEFRLGEEMAAVLFKGLKSIFTGPLKKYRAIEGKTVAKAMYKVAQEKEQGKVVYASEEIAKIAQNE